MHQGCTPRWIRQNSICRASIRRFAPPPSTKSTRPTGPRPGRSARDRLVGEAVFHRLHVRALQRLRRRGLDPSRCGRQADDLKLAAALRVGRIVREDKPVTDKPAAAEQPDSAPAQAAAADQAPAQPALCQPRNQGGAAPAAAASAAPSAPTTQSPSQSPSTNQWRAIWQRWGNRSNSSKPASSSSRPARPRCPATSPKRGQSEPGPRPRASALPPRPVAAIPPRPISMPHKPKTAYLPPPPVITSSPTELRRASSAAAASIAAARHVAARGVTTRAAAASHRSVG